MNDTKQPEFKTLRAIADSVKASQGSCKETNIELVKCLQKEGIEASILLLPGQNHVVTGIGDDIVIDPNLEIDYNAGVSEKVFSRDEHMALMAGIAKRKPFNCYMSADVVYKPVKF